MKARRMLLHRIPNKPQESVFQSDMKFVFLHFLTVIQINCVYLFPRDEFWIFIRMDLVSTKSNSY